MTEPMGDELRECWGKEPPWKVRGAFRLDAEPHRARLLSLMGEFSLACGVLSLLLYLPGLIGLPLSAATISTAREDLRRMELGRMDPRGRLKTLRARRLACFGATSSVLSWLVVPLLYFALAVLLGWPFPEVRVRE